MNTNNLFNCQTSDLEAFICNECPYFTQLMPYFKHHLKTDHNRTKTTLDNHRNLYICKVCSFQTHSYFLWFIHKRKGCYAKTPYQRNPEAEELFSMEYEYVTSEPSKLRVKKWFICQHCDYRSKVKVNMQTHIIRRHIPDDRIKWFICDQCGYKTKTNLDLKQHFRFKHVSADSCKWFDCLQCEYKCKSRGSLKVHFERKHTGITYDCIECGHGCRSNQELKRHVVSKHRPEVWIQCSQCKYRGSETLLRQHVRIRHTRKSYSCSSCAFITIYKANLKSHVLAKHPPDGEKVSFRLFPCKFCDYKSKKQSNLKRHTEKKHLKKEFMKIREFLD